MKLKKIVIATLAMLSMTTAVAETRSVGGAAYLLSMPKDISEDFLDLSNTYFLPTALWILIRPPVRGMWNGNANS